MFVALKWQDLLENMMIPQFLEILIQNSSIAMKRPLRFWKSLEENYNSLINQFEKLGNPFICKWRKWPHSSEYQRHYGARGCRSHPWNRRDRDIASRHIHFWKNCDKNLFHQWPDQKKTSFCSMQQTHFWAKPHPVMQSKT